MGKFQGILGMDWLGKNKAEINCGLGSILFTSSLGTQVQIHGSLGRNPLKIVKAKRIANGFKKFLPIYILKINKPKKVEEGWDPGLIFAGCFTCFWAFCPFFKGGIAKCL